MMNIFYFISKAVFFLKIFTILIEKSLIKKADANFKVYDVTDILPDISKCEVKLIGEDLILIVE